MSILFIVDGHLGVTAYWAEKPEAIFDMDETIVT